MRRQRTLVIRNHSIDRSLTPKAVIPCTGDIDLRAEYAKGEESSSQHNENLEASSSYTHETTSSTPELTYTDNSPGSLPYGSVVDTSPELIPTSDTSGKCDEESHHDDEGENHGNESFCCIEARRTPNPTSALIFHCYSCNCTFCSRHWDQQKAHKRNETGHNKMVAAVARMFNDPVNEQLDEKVQALLHLFDESSRSWKIQHHQLVQMSEYLLYCVQCMREKIWETLTHCEEGPAFPPLDILKRKHQQHVVTLRQREDSAQRNTNRLLRLLQERLAEVNQRIVSYRDLHDRTQFEAKHLQDSASDAASRAKQAAAKVKESESFLELCQTRAQDTRMVLGLEIRRFWYLPSARQTEIQKLLTHSDAEIKRARHHLEDCRRVSQEDHETLQELKQETGQLSQYVYELEQNHVRFIQQTQNEANHVFNWFQSLHRELIQLRLERQSFQNELTKLRIYDLTSPSSRQNTNIQARPVFPDLSIFANPNDEHTTSGGTGTLGRALSLRGRAILQV